MKKKEEVSRTHRIEKSNLRRELFNKSQTEYFKAHEDLYYTRGLKNEC